MLLSSMHEINLAYMSFSIIFEDVVNKEIGLSIVLNF
jgi:hypothetical protein